MEQESSDQNIALIQEADTIKSIANPQEYSRVAQMRGLIKDMITKIEADQRPGIDEAFKHHRNLLKNLTDKINPLQTKHATLGRLLVAFDIEQENIKRRRELEIEAEQKRKAEEEKQQLAKLAAEMGDEQLAKEIKGAPLDIAPVVVVKETPSAKESGVSFREDFKFEIVDPTKIPCAYHTIDEVKIGKVVRAMKLATAIPGIRVFSVKVPIQKVSDNPVKIWPIE